MQWTEDLSDGIAAIDNQRKELFSRINSLVEAIRQGKCRHLINGSHCLKTISITPALAKAEACRVSPLHF